MTDGRETSLVLLFVTGESGPRVILLRWKLKAGTRGAVPYRLEDTMQLLAVADSKIRGAQHECFSGHHLSGKEEGCS